MPYAPGTEYRGDQYIFQGGQRTAQAISGWLENFLNEQKQTTAAGKSADYFVKANPKALDEMGIHPEAWTNLGAREKASAVQGYFSAQAAQQHAAETQARQMQVADLTQGLAASKSFQQAIQRFQTAGQPMLDVARAPAPVLKALGQFMPGMGDAGQALEDLPQRAMPSGQDILQMGLQSGMAPEHIGRLADSLARIQALDGKGNKRLSFTTSPTGATIALSPDTGAFQYDPFSKAQAESGSFSVKDALKAYNDNQERINTLQTRLKMAQDPKNADLPFDADALQAELEDLKAQQPDLRGRAGLKAAARPTVNPPSSAPGKRKRYNPATGKIETF